MAGRAGFLIKNDGISVRVAGEDEPTECKWIRSFRRARRRSHQTVARAHLQDPVRANTLSDSFRRTSEEALRPEGWKALRQFRKSTMAESYLLKSKICLVGEQGVGKTSLIRRYVLDQFDDRYVRTLGAKVEKKSLRVALPGPDGLIDVNMAIWDIIGHVGFRHLLGDSFISRRRFAAVMARFPEAERRRLHKMICMQCYARNAMRATRCRKCGSRELRPKAKEARKE